MAVLSVQIVTYNTPVEDLRRCIASVESSSPLLSVTVIDNGSSREELLRYLSSLTAIRVVRNKDNLGFAAAHNQGVAEFLKSSAEYLLILNPDAYLDSDFIPTFLKFGETVKEAAIFTPKILREDRTTIDAAGMVLTSTYRHFDRGSGEPDIGQYDTPNIVFGGTGAVLILNRSAVERLAINQYTPEMLEAISHVYPQLGSNSEGRIGLFDEAFFAYREDADLALRARKFKVPCYYRPELVAYHRRSVLPERRGQLSAFINLLGVKNRFLLQVNNFSWSDDFIRIIPGIIVRNVLVIIAVIVGERTSLPAFLQVARLFKRAIMFRAGS